uniref:Uncharacterized protein n=1 Tax=Arundo donax TaxID=35708 RepID=A0A0A9FGH8_ARUDO
MSNFRYFLFPTLYQKMHYKHLLDKKITACHEATDIRQEINITSVYATSSVLFCSPNKC